MPTNSFGAASTLRSGNTDYRIFRLRTLEEKGAGNVSRLPFATKILLENLLRQEDGRRVTAADIEYVARGAGASAAKEISFMPARVLLQDFTGVPCVVDLAAMRDALRGHGRRPEPRQSADAGRPGDRSLGAGGQLRHRATRSASTRCWNSSATASATCCCAGGRPRSSNFRVVPPDTGIVHQVNLEYLASVVFRAQDGWQAYPDTLVGTDSHTTMINGLGVLGWGVGGIEAEACMLGQPISMLLPPVVGFKLHGKLPEGCTATDLVLTITQMLRKKGVVGKFVEFYGPGLSALSLADRATVANMAPEYGATIGFFPVDAETLAYLRFTNRDAEPDRAGGSLHQGAGPVPHRRDARPGVCRHAGAGSGDSDAVAGRAEAPAGSRRAAGCEEELPRRRSAARTSSAAARSTAKPPPSATARW